MFGMRYLLVSFLYLFVTAGNAYPFYGPASEANAAQVVPGRLIVKFRTESRPQKLSLSRGVMTTGVTGIDALNRTYRVTNLIPFLPSRTCLFRGNAAFLQPRRMLPDRGALSKAELERAIEGHVTAHAELIGTYEKQKR